MAILKSDTTIGGRSVLSEIDSKLSANGGIVSGSLSIVGNITLKGGGAYGNKINFGDGDYVHIYEIADDKLEIKASNLHFLCPNAMTQGIYRIPRVYSAVIGDGVATSFSISHNLNTNNIQVVGVRDSQPIWLEYTITNTNAINIIFGQAPSASSVTIIITG